MEAVQLKSLRNQAYKAVTGELIVSDAEDALVVADILNQMSKQNYHIALDYDEDGWSCYFYKRGQYDQNRVTYAKSMNEAIYKAVLDSNIKEDKIGKSTSMKNIQSIAKSTKTYLDCIHQIIETEFYGGSEIYRKIGMHPVLGIDYGTEITAMQSQHPYAHKDFVPERDLPNPYPGDTYRTDPGSSAEWYAPNNYQWIEYDYDPLIGKYATGREVDYRNQVLTEKSIETKTVQKTIVKSSTCECKTLYNYQWKIYESLISRDANFEYCGKCGDKRNV